MIFALPIAVMPASKRTKFYSMYTPLTWITRSNLFLKACTESRKTLCGIFRHAFSKEALRASTLLCGFKHASVSKTDHTQKSIGLRSGLEGGQTSFAQKSGISFLSQVWVRFAVCEGAPSCMNVQGLFLNNFRPQCFSTGSRIKSW